MKVIKRDGRAVDFKSEKISIAIEKANTEVKGKEKATKKEIEEIIKYIEDLDKKRILVEDIQDIIEQKLMEIQKYNLAKKYIVYRYTRALVRKQNTTDESILGLIKKSNRTISQKGDNHNAVISSMQRDLIAGEVSKDLTRRILLPEKIIKAHDEEILYFHDAEYFLQPIVNSCVINLKDMLDNGTVINGKMIDTPKSFQVACTVMTQIALAVASSQYGKQYIDVSCLGKYLRKSHEKYTKQLESKYKNKISTNIIKEIAIDRVRQELNNGVQTILNQINTLITTNGKPPCTVLLLDTQEGDLYKEENAMITEEIIRQINQGIKNEKGEYEKVVLPELITDTKTIHKILDHKFDQGKVSINLEQIAKLAEKNEERFWTLLDEKLEICHEALMYRHYALLGTPADISPIQWRYGAIARLEQGETIDKLLKDGNSTLTLGYKGIQKAIELFTGEESNKEGIAFEKNILKILKEKIQKWRKESGIDFII
ncbi:MAG: hypothetical protein IKF83_02350 [Clostridia bacterium]|nr:hypothetical protein [Clostridia bacterium]